MSTIIFTIGTRDAVIDKTVLQNYLETEEIEALYDKDKPSRFLARPGGKMLLEHFDQLAAHIKIPIVSPSLELALSRSKDKGSRLDRMLMVATDQGIDVADYYRKNDSIYFAQLITRLLYVRFPELMTGLKVDIIPVGQDVAFLDRQYQQWTADISLPPFDQLHDSAHIYLCNQGGIVALNTALMFACLKEYRDKVIVINVNEATGSATPLSFTSQYVRERETERAQTHLTDFEYHVFEELQVSEDARMLAAYASRRLNFDFEGGLKVLENQKMKQGDAFRKRLIAQNHALISEVKSNKSHLLLQELVLNAQIKWQQKAYVDFLLRFFRLVESLTQRKVEQLVESPVNFNKFKRSFDQLLKQPRHQGLRSYLAKKKVHLKASKATIPTLLNIIEYDRETHQEFLHFIRKTEKLRRLRNKSIGAHDFAPVSEEKIQSYLASMQTHIKEVFEFLERETGLQGHAFEEINAEILRLLKSE